MLKYREVLCPKCKQKFIWNESSEWDEFYYIVGKEGERARQATCTTCNTKLAVFKGELEGVVPDDRSDLVYMKEYGI